MSFKFHLKENTGYADDGSNGDITLGHVEAPKGTSHKKAIEVIDKTWRAFQDSMPDCDTEFIKWLTKVPGFKRCKGGEEYFV